MKQRVIKWNDLEAVKAIFYGLLEGENRNPDESRRVPFEASGMRFFLDWLKRYRPWIFEEREAVFELLYDLPAVRPFCEPADFSFLVEVFREYLSPELRADKDILMVFLEAEPWGYELPDYPEYGAVSPGIPLILYNLPDALRKDEDVISALLRKTDPVSIVTEIFEREELLEDSRLRMYLLWYDRHYYGPAFTHTALDESLNCLYELWTEALTEKGIWYTKEADEVSQGISPYVRSSLSMVVDDFLEYLKVQAESDKIAQRTRCFSKVLDSYKPALKKKVAEEIKWAKHIEKDDTEERVRDMKAFAWEDSFKKLIVPFQKQFEMFYAALVGDFSSDVFSEKKPVTPTGNSGGNGEDGGMEDGGMEDGGMFFNIPAGDSDLPF